MKLMYRWIALLLVCLMAFPLWSCGKDEEGPATDSSVVSTEQQDGEDTDPNLRKNHKDNLPSDLDFEEQEVIVYTSGQTADIGKFDITSQTLNWFGTQAGGNTLTDSVWIRNRTVEERLNVKLTFVLTDTTGFEAAKTKFKNSVSTGDYFCDIMTGGNNIMGANGLVTYFRDISNIPYVEWNQPWWWNEMNDAYSMDGKSLQLVTGDVLLATYGYGNVVFYNRNMYAKLYQNADEPYDLVLSGQWTYEKFAELIAGAYSDGNGDGLKNAGDTYGIVFSAWKSQEFSPLLSSTTLSLGKRDDSGKMIIDINEDTMSVIMGKFWSLIENTGTYTTFSGESPSVGDRDKVIQDYFVKGKSLFQQHRLLATAEYLTNMEDDYGILPIPMLDNYEGTKYYSGVETRSDVLGLPLSVPDSRLGLIGATLEALSAESHRECVDYFIDTAMRYRYSREEKSGMTIDLVLANMQKQWLTENSGLTSSNGKSDATLLEKTIFEPLRKNQKTSFSTLYAMYKTAAQNKLNDAFDTYMAVNG